MRKYLFISFVFLIVGLQAVSAQKKTKDILTTGKWYVSTISMGEEVEKLPDEVKKQNWIVFYPDGRFENSTEENKFTGTWKYNEKTKILTTKDKEMEIKQEVLSIDEKKLVLQEGEKEFKIIIELEK